MLRDNKWTDRPGAVQNGVNNPTDQSATAGSPPSPPTLGGTPAHPSVAEPASPRIGGRGADRTTIDPLHQFRRPSLTKWLVLLSFLIVTHEMAAALVLSNGRSRTLGLGSGMASRLVFDPSIAPTVIGLAILLPTVLLLLFYWWLLRGSIDPPMKSAKKKDSQ